MEKNNNQKLSQKTSVCIVYQMRPGIVLFFSW